MEISKALGKGATISFRGKDYELAPLTFGMQAKFEHFLKQRAINFVKEMRDNYSDEEYRAQLSDIRDKGAAGMYSFGGQVCQDAFKSLPGLKEILRLSLQKNYPAEVTHEFIDALVEEKLQEVQEKIGDVNSDPFTKGETTP